MTNRYTYPDKLEIKPLDRPVNATIRVPGSKSITNRALVLAALASKNHRCEITGALYCDDTDIMVNALNQLGFLMRPEWAEERIVVEKHGSDMLVPARSADLFLGNSGTSLRFLTAVCALGRGAYRLDGDTRMRQRPIEDLLDALRQLEVDAHTELGNGCPPIVICTSGHYGPYGTARIRGEISSQFVSALWVVAAYANMDFHLITPVVSEPFLEMTRRMLTEWGHRPVCEGDDYTIDDFTSWRGIPAYHVEVDATSASYAFAAAAITHGEVRVPGLPSHSLQGDIEFANLLQEMGAGVGGSVGRVPNEVTVRGAPLHGITADMNAISDTVPTLAAVACFADGPTTIRNVAHIRHKECDRISALCTELRKLGVEVDEYPDGMKITPRPMHGAEIETYNDHRIAMSMALIGLKVPGVVIKNPGCVAKTYPGYWEDFQKLYA